jgi:hypothetical protein
VPHGTIRDESINSKNLPFFKLQMEYTDSRDRRRHLKSWKRKQVTQGLAIIADNHRLWRAGLVGFRLDNRKDCSTGGEGDVEDVRLVTSLPRSSASCASITITMN